MTFVHLHCHSHYSLLDGLPKPKDYLQKAKAYGATAQALTDHGNLYGAIEFYKEAKNIGIKPIIGIEAYTAASSRFSKQTGIDNKIGHIILLARNKKGYENLIALSSKAHLEGFYYKPRIDHELLKIHGEGLIILTACLNGDIPKSLLANNWDKADQILKTFKEAVGSENVFLELQNHPQIMEQGIANERLIKLAQQTNTPLVATNDCHCLNREDREAHDVLLCVQTGSNVDEPQRFKMEGDFSMTSPEEISIAFADIPEAITNTEEIAAMCNLEIDLGQNLLPAYKTPEQKPAAQYLRELCAKGLKKRYGNPVSKEIKDRLDYELETIHKMGFDTYFLIVHDFVDYAKKNHILVGPGRGSAAGSIVSYCLEITDIDPIKYNLVFERFLNVERISMPDIDIDFADNRRDEVLNYVVNKYGKDHVAQIITFGTMAARAAVRDVGRALGLPYSEVDVIAKLIPGRPGIKLKEALEEEIELKNQYENSPNVKRMIDLALKLEGVVRHASVHACAVVISEKPLLKYTPLQLAPGGQEAVITQYSMHDIEDIGLLKMDFLGLKNLTILDYALKIIQRTKNENIILDELPLDDEKTFELMAKGATTGIFQFESAGMRRYLKELKPTRLEDLIAMNALYRPGPMEWIPEYIKGKHNAKKVKYLHDSFKSILEETYGVAVYQEQILQITRIFADFTPGEADILRKAVGKKKPELLEEQRIKFIKGAINKNHSKQFAKEVFEKVIEPFAGYGFNKAHATCYSMIAYRTAYLKSHYPAEFMAALMTSDRDNTDRLVIEIAEAEAIGIKILPPSINESMANFTVVDDQNIRFGLAAIKGIGIGTVHKIIAIREESGDFKNIDDLAKRVPYSLLNKKTIEAMAYSGALDNLGERKAIASNVEEIMRYARLIQTHSNENQTDIFSMLSSEDQSFPSLKLPETTPASLLQRLSWEKSFLGLYVSGHPLQGLSKYLKKKAVLINTLNKTQTGKIVKIVGILIQVKKITTKTNSQMAYLTLEDPTARLDVAVFPNTFATYRHLCIPESVVIISGKLEYRANQLQLICQTIQAVSLETMIAKAKEDKLYNPNEKIQIVALNDSLSTLPKPEQEDQILDNISLPEKNNDDLTPLTIDQEEKLIISLKHENTSPENLNAIKNLLLHHSGTQTVEIQIPHRGLIKRIKVPFGVNITENLKRELSKLIL